MIPGLVKTLTYTPRVLTGIASGGAHVPTVHLGSTLAASYLQAYFTVAVFMAAAVGMVGAMLGVGRLLRPTRPQEQKYISYESGVDPLGGWGQAHVRYYLYALLFVMFDVEAVFIFPWAVRLESLGTYGLIEMIVFILILALGLLYAWRKGVLRWA
jgi:NADH-quinone oxidoreductase subunit A